MAFKAKAEATGVLSVCVLARSVVICVAKQAL